MAILSVFGEEYDDSTSSKAFKGYKLKTLRKGLRDVLEGDPDMYLRRGSDMNLEAQLFLTLGEWLLELVGEFGSGKAIHGVSLLRTFVYWRVSEHAKISLYASSRRVPQLDAFADHIRLCAAEKIYHIVAEAFKESIELVYEDEASIPLSLPPSLSIFLDLYRSSHDLSKAIDKFRSEFVGVRQDLRLFEERLTKAKTLQERIELKRQLGDIAKPLKTHYQMENDSVLETVLGFAPEVLNPLSNPADPSKYSEKLLTQPIKWVKGWWRKRPFRHVYHLRKRLYQIADYEQLASEVLGVKFNEEASQRFRTHYDGYLALYQRRT